MPKNLTPNIKQIYHMNDLKANRVVQCAGISCNEFDGSLSTVSILQETNNGNSVTVYTLPNANDYDTELDFADSIDNYTLGKSVTGHAQSMSPYISDTNIITMKLNDTKGKVSKSTLDWPNTIGIMSNLYLDLPSDSKHLPNSRIVRYKNLLDLATLPKTEIKRLEFGLDTSSQKYACLVFTSSTAYSFVVVTYDGETDGSLDDEKGLITNLEAIAEDIGERFAMQADTDSITDDDYLSDALKLNVISKTTIPIQNLNMLTEIIANQHGYHVSNNDHYSTFSLQGVSMDDSGNVYLSSGFSPKNNDTQQNPIFIVKMPNFAKSSIDNWSLIDLTNNQAIQKSNCFIELESLQMYASNDTYLSIAYHDRINNMQTIANSLVHLTF